MCELGCLTRLDRVETHCTQAHDSIFPVLHGHAAVVDTSGADGRGRAIPHKLCLFVYVCGCVGVWMSFVCTWVRGVCECV